MTADPQAITRDQGTMSPGRVEVASNISQHFFEEEREVYKQVWLMVAAEREIPNIGDFVVKTIENLGLSVLIVRGRDNIVRAFHNICRHRGNRLVKECRGSASGFICGFHGWAHDLEGRLRFVYDQPDFVDFDKSNFGLLPVSVDIWQGLIFVNLNRNPIENLRTYLGEVADRLDGYGLEQFDRFGHYSSEVHANWKTVQDAFIEAYHVRTVHQRSLPDLKKEWIPREMASLGRHSTMSAWQNLAHAPKPTESIVWGLSSGFMRASDFASLPPGINAERKRNWIFDQFTIFPNLLFMIGDGWYTRHEFWPVTVDQCHWEASYFVRPSDDPVRHLANEFYKVRVRDTVREDLECIEGVHASHRTGVLDYMTLCAQESQIRHHRAVLADYMAGRYRTTKEAKLA